MARKSRCRSKSPKRSKRSKRSRRSRGGRFGRTLAKAVVPFGLLMTQKHLHSKKARSYLKVKEKISIPDKIALLDQPRYC